jgi:hypothetical protein
MLGSPVPRPRVERAMSLQNGRPVARERDGRSCAVPGCATRLSRYNPNKACATHGGWADSSARRRRKGL